MAAFLAVPDCARAARGVRLDQSRFHFDRSPHRRADRLGRGLAAGRAGAPFRSPAAQPGRRGVAPDGGRRSHSRPSGGPPPAAADPPAAARPPDGDAERTPVPAGGAFAPTASHCRAPARPCREPGLPGGGRPSEGRWRAVRHGAPVRARGQLGAGVRRAGRAASSAPTARRPSTRSWRTSTGSSRGPCISRSSTSSAAEQAPGGRRAGGRRPVLVGRQHRHPHAVSRLLRPARAARRYRRRSARRPPRTRPSPSSSFSSAVHHPFATALIADLDTLRRANVDRTFLTSFGRFWEESKGINVLIEPDDWKEALAAARTAALAAPARSLLVSGENRVGKTSFLRLLAARLRERGLDRVRGRRRRSDGGPAVVRTARGAHPARARRAYRLQEDRLVHPRHPADGAERHAPGAGRQPPRPDPAGHHRRPAGGVDGGLARRHHAPPAPAPGAARRRRAGAHGAPGPGGYAGAGPGPRAPPGGGDGDRDRCALRRDGARARPAST